MIESGDDESVDLMLICGEYMENSHLSHHDDTNDFL